MPARLVINPVILDGGARKPKVSVMEDPGRAAKTGIDEQGQPFSTQPTYCHSSAISDGQAGQRNDLCLSLVVGIDFAPLDADPEVTTLFEMPDRPGYTLRTYLEKRPSEAGLSKAKIDRLRQRIGAVGVASLDLPDDAPLYEWANRLASRFGNFDMRQALAKVPGA